MLSWLRARFANPSAPALYSFHRGPVFTNGAQEMVFNQHNQLPSISYRGAGRVPVAALKALQPNMGYNLSVPVVGLGGLQTGQYALQPLVNSDDLGIL